MSVPVIVSLYVDRETAITVLENAARSERAQAQLKVRDAAMRIYQHMMSDDLGTTLEEGVAEDLLADGKRALREFTQANHRAEDLETKAASFREDEKAAAVEREDQLA